MSFRIFTQFKRLLKQAFIPNVSCLNLHLLSLFFSSPIASHFFHIVNPRWYHSCDLFYAMNQEHDSRDRDQKSGAWGSQAVKLKSRRGCQSILTNKLNRVMISFGNDISKVFEKDVAKTFIPSPGILFELSPERWVVSVWMLLISGLGFSHLEMHWRTVFTDSGFPKWSLAHVVISFTESY